MTTIEILESTGKGKIEFKPFGLRFKAAGGIRYLTRAYKIRGQWFYNIASEDDDLNTSALEPNAEQVLRVELQRLGFGPAAAPVANEAPASASTGQAQKATKGTQKSKR